jgi:hypothetical protein
VSRKLDPGDYDYSLTFKRDRIYETAMVNFDVDRGKVWLLTERGEAFAIEAPRLRLMLRRYDEQLAASGLPPVTEDGYGR